MTELQSLMLAGEPPASSRDVASLYFVGNATVLLRWAGMTLLTDPTFIHKHEQVSIGYGLHATRLTDPALEIADLPPLDLVLLSHFHGDHFDQVAERELAKGLPILTTPEAVGILRQKGFQDTIPLERWSSLTVRKGVSAVRITALPRRHGPPMVEFALPDVMGSMVEFLPDGQQVATRLYISGDTLVFDDLREIPSRYPAIDLALLHLGGTRVMGIAVTMDAEEGVHAVQIVQPRRVLPIHFDDYDVFKSPLSEFLQAAETAGLADYVQQWTRGDTVELRMGGE